MNKSTDYVYGRNAIIEAIMTDKAEKIFISYGTQGATINKILAFADKANVPCVRYDKRKFNKLEKEICPTPSSSQGVIALIKRVETVELEDLIEQSLKVNAPLLVLLDGITDPHNLGAISRSVECVGGQGIIMEEKNSSPINSVAIKVSAGALEHLSVCKVSNLIDAINLLKENGFVVIGTHLNGDKYYDDIDYRRPIALIIGSEGKGMRPHITKQCDVLTKIPMKGKIQSLNASVSTGVILFEILRQRSAN